MINFFARVGLGLSLKHILLKWKDDWSKIRQCSVLDLKCKCENHNVPSTKLLLDLKTGP